jgi:hypothetical protein
METHIESQTGAYGQRGAAENSGEKPKKVAEKHLEVGCEAMIERIRSQREKTTDDGTGRNSEIRRNSSGMVKSRHFCFGVLPRDYAMVISCECNTKMRKARNSICQDSRGRYNEAGRRRIF